MIIWLTGQPCAGKTVLGDLLKSSLSQKSKIYRIDGDDLRELTVNKDYSEKGRRDNIATAQKLTHYLQSQNKDNVIIVSLVAPYIDMREDFKSRMLEAGHEFHEVYVHTSEARERDHYHSKDYVAPETNFIDIDTTNDSPEESLNKIMKIVDAKPMVNSKTHAVADKESSSSLVKYSAFFGRWQPWHGGHRWLIDQRLNEGKNVWVAIRDVTPCDKNPFTAEQVFENVKTELADLIAEGRVVLSIVPDIESLNYGRGVGYDVIEHTPPKEIFDISATKIREEMKKKGLI